ncbi:cytochrome P450 [Methylotetracoccus oryzae]|uniref:cytochrome P450 n=1 Tax=Methylotetracoccus oryzae TaxID=1919059 RepID=UPI001118C16C|nr:cytochrome P450 [Methylotetracoccus oryzae]
MSFQPIDLANPDFLADPYPTYARLRDMGPLLPMAPGVWLVTRHGVADTVLRNPGLGRDFAASAVRRYGPHIMDEPAFRMVGRFLLLMNPPEHTRLRTLLSKAFGVKQAAELRRLAMTEAERLLAKLKGRGTADLVSAFNYPFPIAVICALMNLSQADRPLFERETRALVKVLEITPLNPEELAAANRAAELFEDYFRHLLAARRRAPGADLISLLLRAEEGTDRLSEDEIIANITLLFLAGHETTANMLGNALWSLFRHPAELAPVRADPELIGAAVDESLRYEPSVHIAARTAFRDLSVEGIAVPAGGLIYVNLGAANRDASVYAEPDRFRLDRPSSEPKALAFGGGIHYCLGARLARIELECGLATILLGLPGLRPENPDGLRWKPTLTIRGLETLPVSW